MEVVNAFNNELSSLYEARPPISKAKMTSITRLAIKAIKFYKHVVQSVEKFIQKCKSEYKVPGLYVIDSIVRQSRHQFTAEKDVFAPRFARNIQQTFLHLFNCPQEDKGKIVRVLNLWQKNQVFTPDVIQPLLDMASLANKDQLVVPPSSNGVQMPPGSTQPRTPTTKPSPVKDPSWLTSSVDINNTTAQPVPTPTITSKLQPSTGVIDPNIMQQLQNLQNLLLDKQHEANSLQNKKDDTVKFDKKLLDFDYDEDDDETPSPQQQAQPTPPLPSIDSLQTILSNPEVLRQLQTLQQQMSDMEDKMRRLKEMRHQEEEFDKHLAQTLPNLPFASECDFKPSSTTNIAESMSPGALSAPPQPPQSQQSLTHPDSVSSVSFAGPVTAPPTPFGVSGGDSDERPQTSDFDERNRASIVTGGGNTGIGITSSDETSWDPKLGNTQSSSDGPIEIIDLIRTESPAKSPSRGSRRRRSPSPRRSSRRSKSRSRSRSRRRRSRTRTRSRSRSRSRSKSREDRERERERRRRGLPPLKKNHLVVCSTTLWIGHLSKLVQQEELSDTFGEFGDIVSINLIPPRGCAFICMNRRQDAAKALQQLRHFKLQGKAITIAWAPGKGMKDKEWKDYWEVEHGVSYIPWNKLSISTDLEMLEDGGVIDEESLPDFLKAVKREAVKHDYGNQMQQSQMHMIKGLEDKEVHTINEHKRADMDVGVANPPGVPPAFIPLPDNSMGGPTAPTAQPPPGMPPMGLIPPFALPPRLLGPMGPMGPLGMGNVPLGVPPPLMMPPPPQQMVGRLPPPFNPPPQMGLMPPPNIGSGEGMDKGKISQIPPPPTPETFPNLSSMVNPFGITLPTLPSFPNTNIMPQAQPPVSQPAINKMPTQMEVDVNNSKEDVKDVKPPITNASELPTPAASLSEVGNGAHNDRTLRKDVERGNSDVGGIAAGGGGGIGLGRKDCDWRETSPRRRDRMEREEKRRRRESPPPRRDERRDDRRGSDERRCDDRRSDERRGSTDRRGSSSRWQSRQNKWHEDNERHDNKSSNSYKDSFGSSRPDKDERPSLLPLPDHFHGGPPLHHDHFKQNPMSHHEQYQPGPPNKPHSHHDQHYQKGSLLGPHDQYQQGPPKGPHHEHYPQGLLPAPHEQQYQQGPMPPHYRQQHDQHDQHFQQSPPMGYGGGGRYPDTERDEMMGSNSDYGHPRGYFNRGHARIPARSPRPLLRTPNGPMFGPRGPPMGGPPMGGPPGCPPPMPLRGHRPGPPGNRMDGPGFMPPRGFPPGIRGRGGGSRFSGGGGREDWEGPQRRRGWEEYPPNHPGPHLGHGGPPGHLGPKSLLGTPGGHTGGPPSLLGSPGHLRLSSPSSMERRKSRWSTNTENKSENQHNQLDETSTPPPVNISEEELSENISDSVDTETKTNTNTKSNLSNETASPIPQTCFELQESSVDEPQTEPEPLSSFEPQEGFDQQTSFEQSKTYDENQSPSYEHPSEDNIQEKPIFHQSVNESRRLSSENNASDHFQNNNHTPNLYEDEVLPITFEPQPSQRTFDQVNLHESEETVPVQSSNSDNVDVEMKDDAPIFDLEKNVEDAKINEEHTVEE